MFIKAFENIAKYPEDDLEYHFIYSEYRYSFEYQAYNPSIESCINKVITEFKLGSAIFTQVNMNNRHLVTKETMEKLYKNEKNAHDIYSYDDLKESVGDDLESFFMNLQIGKLKDDSRTFYLPKILPFERKMIEERNIHFCVKGLDHYDIPLRIFMQTFYPEVIPLKNEMKAIETIDVSKVEMDLSESNSKYILSICDRRTVRLPGKKYATRKRKHETK